MIEMPQPIFLKETNMKLSQLISDAQALARKWGDLEIAVEVTDLLRSETVLTEELSPIAKAKLKNGRIIATIDVEIGHDDDEDDDEDI